tara:strand:+ start:816 stop:1103 length:288 start_codon:yes stop_codon:yes gene_type:complete
MKKIIYLGGLVLAMSLFSCSEAKKDVKEVGEGFKDLKEEVSDDQLKNVEEGVNEAAEDVTDEPLEKVEEGIEEAGESIKGDVEIIEEDVKEELEH